MVYDLRLGVVVGGLEFKIMVYDLGFKVYGLWFINEYVERYINLFKKRLVWLIVSLGLRLEGRIMIRDKVTIKENVRVNGKVKIRFRGMIYGLGFKVY